MSSATSLLVLENEALFEDHGLARTNRDRVARERAAQEGRAEAIDLDVQARGPAGTLGTVAARPAERVWEFDLGIGGGGGAGAGDPLTLLVLLGGVAAAARRRRALAEGA